jgi:hypothetical protein
MSGEDLPVIDIARLERADGDYADRDAYTQISHYDR